MSQLEVDKVIPQSGTTLTLGENGDTVSVPSGATLDASNATLTLPDGSVTAAKLASTAVDNTNTNSTVITGQTAETSIDGADSILIYDDSATALRKMTRTNFVAGIGGVNTPAFHAYPTGSRQTVGHGTYTKVTMTAESFDTDNAFASSRFTVPSGKGGKYFIYWSVEVFYGSNNGFDIGGAIFKNGSQFTDESNAATYPTGLARHLKSMNSGMFDLSDGDYLEVYVKQQNNGSTSEGVDNASVFGSGATWGATYFGGYKIIE